MITPHSSVVATFASHATAEAAVKKLQLAHFDMKQLSVAGGDYSDSGADAIELHSPAAAPVLA